MKPGSAWRGPASIRTRLLAALAIALLPVLILGVVQSIAAFNKDEVVRREALLAAAERSAATAQARVESSAVLLETLDSQAVGLACSQKLAQVLGRLPGYQNLIRIDAIGRVSCTPLGASIDLARRDADWFTRLRDGDNLVVTPAPAGLSKEPALLAAVRAERGGTFDGAMVAVIRLDSLRPEKRDAGLPAGAEVALADGQGVYLTQTKPEAFPAQSGAWTKTTGREGLVFEARARSGEPRVYAVAPLVDDDFFVVVSAPSQGLAAWTGGNMLSSVAPPVLAFLLALIAVWIVTNQVVVRWLHYLQRVASIYAKGRFTVRATQAKSAPPEIRELAETLDLMADTIVARDADLLESLAQKDDLMREIHHRVKNNLQVISSLVNMQQRALADPAARAAMHDTRLRIAALALVYRALYQGPDLRQVDLKGFLEELTAQLVVSESAHGHVVHTELHADHLVIDPDKLAPLALFAVEAITNAQKHAFAGRGGELSVSFRVDGAEARLQIADAGGVDNDTTPPEVGPGVGRTLMTAFARQLGGRAEFSANDRGGVTAQLIFPVKPEQSVTLTPPAKSKRNQAAA